jgi:hypothetical protein
MAFEPIFHSFKMYAPGGISDKELQEIREKKVEPQIEQALRPVLMHTANVASETQREVHAVVPDVAFVPMTNVGLEKGG